MSDPSAATPPAAAADTIPDPSISSQEAGRAPAHDDHDQGNRVLYRDLRDFQRKRQRIVDEGAEQLQIISGISQSGLWVLGLCVLVFVEELYEAL